MTRTSNQISARRTAKTAAIGAAALTAVVALPAFAIDRGGDDAVEAVTAADTAGTSVSTSTSTTSTTLSPDVQAWIQAQANNDVLTWLATLTPEQQFHLVWSSWTPAQQQEFTSFVAYQEELGAFYAGLEAERVRQADADRAAQAASAPRVSSTPASSSGAGVWDRLAQCETGGNWSHPTVSGGFSGGLMFHYATWNAMGGQAYAPTAAQATKSQQIDVAERILASSGWGAWPGARESSASGSRRPGR